MVFLFLVGGWEVKVEALTFKDVILLYWDESPEPTENGFALAAVVETTGGVDNVRTLTAAVGEKECWSSLLTGANCALGVGSGNGSMGRDESCFDLLDGGEEETASELCTGCLD